MARTRSRQRANHGGCLAAAEVRRPSTRRPCGSRRRTGPRRRPTRLQRRWGRSTEVELQRAGRRYAGGGFFWDRASSAVILAVEPTPHGWVLGGFDCFDWQTCRKNAAGQVAAGEHVVIVPWWFVAA